LLSCLDDADADAIDDDDVTVVLLLVTGWKPAMTSSFMAALLLAIFS